MKITYEVNVKISVEEFVDLLKRSSLAERRPVEDLECMTQMLEHGSLLITAKDGDKLIGVARSLTDFKYACYLSELAVDESYQRKGIGKALIEKSLQQLGPKCKMRLIAAPAAADYYTKVGFSKNERCWEICK